MKTAFEKKTAKHETYRLSYETDSFEKFLRQCKRAMNKLHGYNMSVKYDEWSGLLVKERIDKSEDFCHWTEYVYETWWERLRRTGELMIQDGFNCIEFIYGHHVFAGFSGRAYVEYGIVTQEELKEFMDKIKEEEI